MNKNIISKFFITCITLTVIGACSKKLDLFPINDLTPEKVYATPEGYKSVLAKLYGTLAVTGNQGPAGAPDIAGGLDEGSQVSFIRGFFNCQELPTDEAVVAWNDQTIKDFHGLKWTTADPFLKGIYARHVYNVSLINEYLREAADDKVASRGINGIAATDIKNSKAEARFLRAFNYWAMLDLFGNSTFITEADLPGPVLPKEIKRADLFNYIEAELKAAETELPAAKSAEYGRVDKGAAWALLARLYLNAQVYTGTAKYTEAITYAKKVITEGGYSLATNYRELFMADNHLRKDEFMFTINCDGLKSRSFGNTTFLIHAPCGGDETDYGLTSAAGGWFGYRSTAAFANLWPDLSGVTDKRAMFTTGAFGTSNSQIAINDIGAFSNGLHINKWRNINATGGAVNDPDKNFADIDFPVFRLPEMYFIYAEAHLRGGAGGNATDALTYINNIRFRAHGNSFGAGDVYKWIPADLTLQNILNERGRELYWEGHRRTDLVRYGLLTTGTYLWPWKGDVSGGQAVDTKFNIFPVPISNIITNSNLSKTPGYNY
jgi:starch-binding outer membrane protein, SusD/RagB family